MVRHVAADHGAAAPVARRPRGAEARSGDALWYKDAVIYEVHVRAFADSNDDGIGDFAGLTSRLEYIQSLGVNVIWLLPFYPSPQKDDGYDIADYRGIHPAYGTLADFREFVREAHRRGLRVITELVINHTSDQHPWFQSARRAPAGSSKRNFYVWSESADRYADARIIFTDTEQSNWSWDPVAGAYYWHRFFSHQPDLNFANPRVVKAVARIMCYWLEQGVDGLRLDAIPYLCEREGTSCENLRETHEVIRELRRIVDARYPGRMLLAEANQWPEDVRDYFGDGDECHMAYHFPLMPRMYMAIAQEDRHPIADILGQTPEIPQNCQWAIFLRNHDELTLEMVTSRERDYMFRMFAADPRARLNLGIRRRLAPLMENDPNRIKLINSLLLSMPGSPIIYFGDEIGMGDNYFLGDRDGVRTPMQWSPDRNAGFSRADPQRLFLPPIMDAVYGYEAVNVEAQERDRSSLLHWMRLMLQVRGSTRAFGRGSMRLLRPGNRKILAYLRRHRDDVLLCVGNLSRHAQAGELSLGEFKGHVPVEMMGGIPFPPIGDLPYMLTLPGHAFYWFRLERRAESPPWHVDQLPFEDMPVLVLFDGWASFFRDRVVPWRIGMADRLRRQLEHEILPGFLETRRWCTPRGTRLEKVSFVEFTEVDRGETTWVFTIVEATPADGRGPVRYQLPLSLAWETDEARLNAAAQVAIARVREHDRIGLLTEALLDEAVAREIVEAIARGATFPCENGQIRFEKTANFASLRGDPGQSLAVSPVPVQGSNAAIALGEKLFLKIYRRLMPGINPEVEVGRFLTEVVRFEHAAAMAGVVQYVDRRGKVSTLAALQEQIPNQGDAWAYTLGYLERFLDERRPHEEDVDPAVHGGYLESVRTLGKRTAELHRALAITTGNARFDPQPLERPDLRHWVERARREAEATFAAVEELRRQADESVESIPEHCWTLAEPVQRRIDAFHMRLYPGVKARHHANYDLSQVMVVSDDFAIVDFEAEPNREAAAHELIDAPLRDVASMLLSFSLAGATVLDKTTERRRRERAALTRAIEQWEQASRSAFLEAYDDVIRASNVCSTVHDAMEVLDLFELERNVFEVRRDIRRRSASLRVSLSNLARLARRERD